MFYVPISLFLQSKRCEVRGPNYKRAKTQNINIGGSEIKFRAPRNQEKIQVRDPVEPLPYYAIPSPNNKPPIDEIDITTREELNAYRKKYLRGPPTLQLSTIDGSKGWKYMTLLVRYWRFNGPNFIGKRAGIQLTLDVLQGKKPKGTSYFHPRILETAIMDRLAEWHGGGHYGKTWTVPLHWQPLANFPCPAATFVAEPNNHIEKSYQHHLIFPVHNDYLIEARFVTDRHPVWIEGKRQDDIEKWTPIAPLETLIKQVIASFEIKLSPEAKTQMQQAQAGLEDASLTTEFAPINIPEYLKNRDALAKEQQPAKQKKLLDITNRLELGLDGED